MGGGEPGLRLAAVDVERRIEDHVAVRRRRESKRVQGITRVERGVAQNRDPCLVARSEPLRVGPERVDDGMDDRRGVDALVVDAHRDVVRRLTVGEVRERVGDRVEVLAGHGVVTTDSVTDPFVADGVCAHQRDVQVTGGFGHRVGVLVKLNHAGHVHLGTRIAGEHRGRQETTQGEQRDLPQDPLRPQRRAREKRVIPSHVLVVGRSGA